MRRMPQSGELYRQQDGSLYQVITVATHAETGERLVVYQALFGDYGVFAGPFSLFMDERDQARYPRAAQRYRFERVRPAAGGEPMASTDPERAAGSEGSSGFGQSQMRHAFREDTTANDAGWKMAQDGTVRHATPVGRQTLREDVPARNAGWNTGREEDSSRPTSSAMRQRPQERAERGGNAAPDGNQASEESGVSPKLMDFFDADSLDEKYNILLSMRDEITDHMINNMAVVMDVVIPEGDTDERYEALKRCIRTRQHYESNRLR